MASYIWSNAISICGMKGPNMGAATDMPGAEAKRFISAVKDALKRLEKLRTGRLLVNEINSSGHSCRIYCAPDGNEGAAQSDPYDAGEQREANDQVVSAAAPQPYGSNPTAHGGHGRQNSGEYQAGAEGQEPVPKPDNGIHGAGLHPYTGLG